MIVPEIAAAYTALFKSLLLYQFKGAENINKLLEIFGDELNDAEALAYRAVSAYFWENAEGDILDTLGRIVVFDRDGRSDSNYKTLLRLKVVLNVSGGEIPALLSAIRQIFNSTETIYYQDFEDDRPVAKIFTNGDINLTEIFEAGISGGSDVIGATANALQDWTTDTGDTLADNNFNVIQFFAPQIVAEDALGFTRADALDERILYDVLPAGVGLYFLSTWATENGDLISDNNGNIIAF